MQQYGTNLLRNIPILSLSIAEEPSIFRDVEAMVSHVNDVVCDMDVGPVIDDGDVEEGRIARFLAAGCSCKLTNGGPCCKIFSPAQYRSQCDECRELTHDELDLVVMGELRALTQRDHVTQMTK